MLIKKILLFFIFSIFSAFNLLFAQEILKSAEEEYYDFLSLQGLADRPTLNYRTLSDSVWNTGDNEHLWTGQNLSVFHTLFGDFRMRFYGPDLFTSANTAVPYGQNDGVLWQGRGFNALFKGGVRFEGYGVELTLLPHFAFSQNADFEIMPSAHENKYGYFWGYGVDAPQRFGGNPFFDWDLGDSEIRYTWKTLTVGFGTQAIWLGPSYLNPILHSNNAPVYPKFDIGLRRQKINLPWLGWYLGDVEARLWTGRLSESDYYDSDNSNDYTMFHGLTLAYAPSFLSGLTVFANRVYLVPWDWKNLKYIFPFDENINEDQKLSFGFTWLFPQVGFEFFTELGIDDRVYGGFLGYIAHFFHSTVFTFGMKKSLQIKPVKNMHLEIIFESNWMEMTQDFQFQWPYSFYFHHQVIHGYTNKGQWLANGISPGGNSQYLSFLLYYPKGRSSLFFNRNNPDNNFLYQNAVYASAEGNVLNDKYYKTNRANFIVGLDTSYFYNEYFLFSFGIVYNLIVNPFYYIDNPNRDLPNMNNASFTLSLKYIF